MIHSTKKKSKKGLIILAVVLLLGIGILSVNIRQITVVGNNRYTDNEIVEMIFQKDMDFNSAYCYLKEKTGDHHPQIPFVEDYKMVFHSPKHVEIIVHEKSVVGYVSYMSSYMYFDKDGIIVESTNDKLDDIPHVTGLDFGHIVLHRPLPVASQKIFEEILNLTQVLEIYGIQVDKIQYNSKGEATLIMGDIEVVLGGSSDTSGKVAELSDMMPQLEGKSGTLYLDTYDPVNTQMMYTFKKKSANN